MATLLDLAKRLEARASSVGELPSDAAKRVATAMLKHLIAITPVDVSTALSNWQVGIGRPVSGPIQAFVPGRRGSTRGASAEEALAHGLFRIQQKKPGETIYLSNTVPYIVYLDKGNGNRPPIGFADQATIVGRNALRK